jgi:hypothetical protein
VTLYKITDTYFQPEGVVTYTNLPTLPVAVGSNMVLYHLIPMGFVVPIFKNPSNQIDGKRVFVRRLSLKDQSSVLPSCTMHVPGQRPVVLDANVS